MYSQKNQVFPQDYSCIIDPVLGKGGLYIGNLQAAQNINTLKKLQIKAVLTSCKGIQLNHPKTQVPYFLYVPAEDHESCDISKYFNQASSFIKDCLQRTNIMVHCMAGVSRSVTLSISYLIKYKRMTFNQAFNLVKSRRKIICPNDGFIDLLKRFQRDLPPIQEKEEIRFYSPVKTSSYADLSAFSYSPKKDAHHQHNIDSIISKYQNYKVGKAFEKNPQTQPYSYQQNLQTSALSSLKPSKLKRYTSVNVDADNYIQTSPSRQQNDQYSRLMNTNSVRPFNNIQNTVNKLNNTEFGDIDKRIEQIRQKYTFESSARPSNYKYECQRSVKYPIEQSRYRARASSGYNDYKKTRESRDYYNYLPQRDPILFMDKRQSFASTYSRGNMPQMSSKQLKRLTSLQQY